MNADWLIDYWPGNKDLDRWFAGLDEDQLKSITKELKLLRGAGNELKLPHSKALGKKLFELREKRYGFRIYYTFHGKQIIILLTAGDKSTQKKDIKIARERLDILLKHGVKR